MMKSPTRFTLATYALALAVATVTANSQPAQTPYGIGAHPAWLKQQERAEEFRWMAATGIQRVRVDFSWQTIQRDKGGPFDFSRYDEVLADAKDAGLAVLPLLGGTPRWASPVYEHIDDWERFVEATVAHYGDRFDEIEPFSEQDVPGQFGDWRTVATNYFPVLRAAYNAAKRANPKIRVFLGGVANIPLDYLGKIYDMGGAAYFDAMNVHPYCHPFPPEKRFDTGLESLRRMMDSRGDSRKPIVVTEIGWPTHATGFSGLNVLPPALKIARPERRTWRTVYAATMPGPDGKPPTDIAEAIEKVLPQGSSVEACFSARLKERLAVGDVDLVIYPLDESFPADTFGEVADFVDRGGVLADFGGVPLCYPVTESAPGLFAAASADVVAMRRRLRITETAFWNDSALPDGNVPAFPTEAALAAGFKGDPAGEKRGSRYQTPALMRPGDEFIPLLTVKDAKNRDATVASVTRLAGGTNGCVIVSGFMTAQAPSANEIGQARYVARTLAIAMAVGVEQFFWYEFRSPEKDPLWAEMHFGLTHPNFTPKPAWGAYRNFVLARPAGSVQTLGPWHDDRREFYFPQWTRPDGTKSGMLWKTTAAEKRTLRFEGDSIHFFDYTGHLLFPVCTVPGEYIVPISVDPVYFEGGALVPPEATPDDR